jgi:aminoacyl tRNA synthase complex-interacting multifunctional protein 1
MASSSSKSAAEMVQEVIADLEAKLGLMPGEAVKGGDVAEAGSAGADNKAQQQQAAAKAKNNKKEKKQSGGGGGGGRAKPKINTPNLDQPEICKLEFKVGQITKVWNHPDADKLYCEEIDVGEESGPRLIASGLRPHYSLEQMQGRRLLAITNLKPRNLVGFKSFGMVLCASQTKEDGSELVEFVEPPPGATLGEIVTFEGLPTPEPVSAAQTEKKKVFLSCMEGMKTLDNCTAAWNGHVFMTSAGPCKSPTIAGGDMR